MINMIQSIRGMHDCLPVDTIVWRRVENILINVLVSYGYKEIRLPIVEFTDLFRRAIGTVTDVVEKEMYDFIDCNGNNLTLRPEGTSGCVRSGIEHGLFRHQEQRWWYLGPMFRHERPQKGRYRQFHQFSAEVFGQIGPDIDAELILITVRCWKELGISQYLSLELNSIGLLSSRLDYSKKLVNFFEKHLTVLDNNTLRRLYSNPMRILDTKNDKIRELLIDAPILNDFLDEGSRIHFFQLCKLLDELNISYTVNPNLVRGLDYYNRTVFEWVTDKLGSKNAVCAGGRYDGLVEQLGGKEPVPAIGFSIGLERVMLLMKDINNSTFLTDVAFIDVYCISIGYEAKQKLISLSEYVRSVLPLLKVMVHHGDDSLNKQFDSASKNNAKIVLVMCKKNCIDNTVLLKDLRSGIKEVLIKDEVVDKLKLILNL